MIWFELSKADLSFNLESLILKLTLHSSHWPPAKNILKICFSFILCNILFAKYMISLGQNLNVYCLQERKKETESILIFLRRTSTQSIASLKISIFFLWYKCTEIGGFEDFVQFGLGLGCFMFDWTMFCYCNICNAIWKLNSTNQSINAVRDLRVKQKLSQSTKSKQRVMCCRFFEQCSSKLCYTRRL